ARDPTFHRVLDVDAAPSVDRLDCHVLDARPSQDRRWPPSLWSLRGAPVRHVETGCNSDLVARDRRDLDHLPLVPVATRGGPHAIAALADAPVRNAAVVDVPAVGYVIDLIKDQEALSCPQVRRVAQGDDRRAFRIARGPVRGVLHASGPAEAPFEANDGVRRGTAVALRGSGEHELRPVRSGSAECDATFHVESRGEGESPRT